jgi:pimeloyl-ACP methyl ester carboxylesterase
MPDSIAHTISGTSCGSQLLTTTRPTEIEAMIYYPAFEESLDLGRRITIWMDDSRPHPLVLYAHGRRSAVTCPGTLDPRLDPALADYSLDYLRIEWILSHLASYGFVVVAPDLGWTMGMTEGGNLDEPEMAPSPRARILLEVHRRIVENQGAWFDNRVGLERIGLIGHSIGAGACIVAKERLPNTRLLGLIAPGLDEGLRARMPQTGHTIVLVGTREITVRSPELAYERARGARFLVRIIGANHFGYTTLCVPDNSVCADLDEPGGISAGDQKSIASAFLSAAARVALSNDFPMYGFLTGARPLGPPERVPQHELRWN